MLTRYTQELTFFLISNSLFPVVLSCSIGNILISGHANVVLDLLPYCETIRSQEPVFKEELRAQIKNYMEIMSPPCDGIAWEAMKALLRVILFNMHHTGKS